MTDPRPRRGRPASSLFRRIYLTFVATVLVFAAVNAGALYLASSRFDSEWVASVDDSVDTAKRELISHLEAENQAAIARLLAAIAGEHRLRLALHSPRGQLLAGDPDLPRPPRHHRIRRLHREGPWVRRRQQFFAPPILHWGIRGADGGPLLAILTADAGDPAQGRWIVGGTIFGLLAILGLGAGLLARSVVRRLAAVEAGAEEIADGDLSHRLPLPRGVRDEVDALAATFNRMAERLDTLIRGQRSLLANVSHELRTPVARMRVLVELLEERAERLREALASDRDRDRELAQRLHRGLGELTEDLQEIEALIADLLTSGKLELASDGGIDRAPIAAAELAQRLGERVSADVTVTPSDLEIDGDNLLLGRLLSNLLANARRACPDGAIHLRIDGDAAGIRLTVEDEGPGIPAEQRQTIFEPFSRLDGARDRDAGGVGLGLYLCRQIARAHGGTIHAEDRRDGRPGARLVVTLPPPPAAIDATS